MTHGHRSCFGSLCLMALVALAAGCGSSATNDSHPTQAAGERISPVQTSCDRYYGLGDDSAPASWCHSGKYFNWQSTLPENAGQTIRIFWRCAGDTKNPAIYMSHGWPTSSYDFEALATDLSKDHYVCLIDAPGHGFSDKPETGFVYSVLDDAALVEHFVKNVAQIPSLTLLSHDRGDSVALELVRRYEGARAGSGDAGYTIKHLIMLNGSIHREQAQISQLQTWLLDPHSGPTVANSLTGQSLASIMGKEVYYPVLTRTETKELATIFDYQNGTKTLDSTVLYLTERQVHEDAWLDTLGTSSVPTTLAWGTRDPFAVPAVADYVWNTFLSKRTSAHASYWQLPCASHYPQHDRTTDIAAIVRTELYKTPFASTAKTSTCSEPTKLVEVQ